MITVSKAQKIVQENLPSGKTCSIPLNSALGYVLSSDVLANINLPPFNQSAMDGYAFRFIDKKNCIILTDEVQAGDTRNISVGTGEAVRIFTGAKVPDGCDAVVMQELTAVEGNTLRILDEGLKPEGNIRKEGHQIKCGDIALKKGTKLNPAGIGFLAALGITEVTVYEKLRVSVIVTGNELVSPGEQLKSGQVYESNTLMLSAALKKYDVVPQIVSLKDDLEDTISSIGEVLKASDLVLVSGGISVGDYDFVKPALEKNGVEELFYKVKQKPGKPLFFGKRGDTLVFALPGNPAAALNCFYMYVACVVKHFIGYSDYLPKECKAKIEGAYKKKGGRAEFLKAIVENGNVHLLEGQGSDVLLTFSKANCLIYLDESIDQVHDGDLVTVYKLH